MNRLVKIVTAAGLLALASYLTTSVIWDGGFPSGEFRIHVRDSQGKPVPSAALRVYHGGSRKLTSGYPLDNHVTGQDLVSGDDGQITTVRKRGGIQFGGHAWRLFWIIPMGAKVPDYDCEITADGFHPLKFPVQRLFKSEHRFYEEFPKTKLRVGDKEIELKVYEQTFTLER